MVLIDGFVLQAAERRIQSCEQCNVDAAEVPFDWILDRATGRDSAQ